MALDQIRYYIILRFGSVVCCTRVRGFLSLVCRMLCLRSARVARGSHVPRGAVALDARSKAAERADAHRLASRMPMPTPTPRSHRNPLIIERGHRFERSQKTARRLSGHIPVLSI